MQRSGNVNATHLNPPPMFSDKRVMLLDDHPVLLHGLEVVLASAHGLEVVGSFQTAGDFIAALAADPAGVDVGIVDYSLGPDDVDCRNLLMALRRRHPQLPVLVLSAQHNAPTVMAALKAGARGFLPKSATAAEIVRVVEALHQGRLHVAADMMHMLTDGIAELPSPGEDSCASLSPREREVLLAVLDGFTVDEIAEQFGRAANTISAQKRAGYRKLGVRSNGELFKLRHLLDLE